MMYFIEIGVDTMNIKRYAMIMVISLLFVLCVGCGKKDKTTNETTTNIIQQPDVTVEGGQVDSETLLDTGLTRDEAGFVVTNDFVKLSGETINVRVSPSTEADIYKLLPNETVLKRTGYNDEWSRVIVDGTEFYIYSDYVYETEPPEDYYEPEVSGDEEVASSTDAPLAKKIVIDPGNQSLDNAAIEPVGPGSTDTKKGASSGKTGIAYGTKEYEINLIYAKLLKEELETRGYEVVLTRDSNTVDITNKSRAELANASGASVFIRLQMNYSANEDMSGVMALTMDSKSPYNSELYYQSNRLATRILQGIVEDTEAINHGIYETNEMTAINWSEIPVAIIKLGFISNSQEEGKLVSNEYQVKLVNGIADGIDYYFGQ